MNDYKENENALNKAEESVVPFAVVDGDAVAVVGDANETQKNAHDFEIKFRIPQKTDEGVKYITTRTIVVIKRKSWNFLKRLWRKSTIKEIPPSEIAGGTSR